MYSIWRTHHFRLCIFCLHLLKKLVCRMAERVGSWVATSAPAVRCCKTGVIDSLPRDWTRQPEAANNRDAMVVKNMMNGIVNLLQDKNQNTKMQRDKWRLKIRWVSKRAANQLKKVKIKKRIISRSVVSVRKTNDRCLILSRT